MSTTSNRWQPEPAAPPRERRYKLLKVDADSLFSGLARSAKRDGNRLTFVDASGLPDDVEVVSVHPHVAFNRNVIGFRLWHPSFPIVPDCEDIPEVELWFTAKTVELLPELDDGAKLERLIGEVFTLTLAPGHDLDEAWMARTQRQLMDMLPPGHKIVILPHGSTLAQDPAATLRLTQESLEKHGVAYWWRPKRSLGESGVLHVLPVEWVYARAEPGMPDYFEIRTTNLVVRIPADEIQILGTGPSATHLARRPFRGTFITPERSDKWLTLPADAKVAPARECGILGCVECEVLRPALDGMPIEPITNVTFPDGSPVGFVSGVITSWRADLCDQTPGQFERGEQPLQVRHCEGRFQANFPGRYGQRVHVVRGNGEVVRARIAKIFGGSALAFQFVNDGPPTPPAGELQAEIANVAIAPEMVAGPSPGDIVRAVASAIPWSIPSGWLERGEKAKAEKYDVTPTPDGSVPAALVPELLAGKTIIGSAVEVPMTTPCKTCGRPAPPTQPDGSGWCEDHRPLF